MAYPWATDVTPTSFDITRPDLIRSAVEGVEAIVYLVHSMTSEDFVGQVGTRPGDDAHAGAATDPA